MIRRLPVLLIGVLWVGVAHADQPDAKKRAAQIFADAKAAYARADYATAARRFEEAAIIAPHPATLLNAAEAWELAGDAARAAEVCDRVIGEPYLDARYHEAATLRLSSLSSKVATLDIVGPTTIRVSIDKGPETAPRRARVAPGRHAIAFTDSATHRTHRGVVELSAGETRRIEARLPEDTASKPLPPPLPSAPRPVEIARVEPGGASPSLGTWISFGVAAIGVGVGAYFGARTLSSRDDFEASPTTATRDAFYRNRAIANGAFLTAAVAAAVGIVTWAATPRRTVGIGPAPMADGAGLLGRASF
jgi:hypothetical protein